MSTIHIKDLALRAIIGIEDWERDKEQDILINIVIEFDASKAIASDNITDTVDYKLLKNRVIDLVAASRFNLIEKLAAEIVGLALTDPKIDKVTVEIDKPHALRFARSVSVTHSGSRQG